MLAFEAFSLPQHMDPMLDADIPLQDQFPAFDMNPYDFHLAQAYNNLSFPFFEDPAIYHEAQQERLKYEMTRSTSSQGSFKHASHQSTELPPSLLSSISGASVPSATSSTVGSPFSGHTHMGPIHDVYHNTGRGFPAIANEEGYTHDFVNSRFEPDLSFAAQEKMQAGYVGEFGDLFPVQQRLSAFPVHVAQHSMPVTLPHPPFCASPRPLHANIVAPSTPAQAAAHRLPTADSLTQPPAAPTRASCPRSADSESIFRSPAKPAAVFARTSATESPAAVAASPSLPLSHPVRASTDARRVLRVPVPVQPYGRHFQDHFFAQSSGSFMPPLESSYPVLISAPSPSFQDASAFAGPTSWPQALEPSHNLTPGGSPAHSPHSYNYTMTQFPPPLTSDNYQLHNSSNLRRSSMSSHHSGTSQQSSTIGSLGYDDDTKEKGRCPNPECGRVFKDLKAHMLTHQSERPEKCPILNCEYNQKGFARKYDKNRHTLTHYKGTMVCGFCPGSGSAAEKSFNRADVFKRHLTSLHGVEQTPPNSRKRSPAASARRLSSYCQDATGKCSTCTGSFTNAQDFYEHLDDCVLRVVQQEEPSEAINARRLAEVAADDDVQATLDRHMIKTEDSIGSMEEYEDEDEEEEEDNDDESSFLGRSGRGMIKSNKVVTHPRAVIGGGITKSGRSSKKGMTWSKGGVPLVAKGRRKRKHYPPSWGMSAEKMQMKKRVLCVYDGGRRLLKDDMMMHHEFEVRMRLANGTNYVTDLDVETLKRAEAFHHATDAEKGPWIPEQAFDLSELMA